MEMMYRTADDFFNEVRDISDLDTQYTMLSRLGLLRANPTHTSTEERNDHHEHSDIGRIYAFCALENASG